MIRPILFSGPMVRALLAGRKTQTRRLLYAERRAKGGVIPGSATVDARYPYPRIDPDRHLIGTYWTLSGWQKAAPGDLLWVRETWGAPYCDRPGIDDGRKPLPSDKIVRLADPADAAQWIPGRPGCADFCWRPSIHMPRWASRLTLHVTHVKVHRLQDISRAGALAEGLIPRYGGWWWNEDETNAPGLSPETAFSCLWDHVNGAGAWDENPWVVALKFNVIHANIDTIGGGNDGRD